VSSLNHVHRGELLGPVGPIALPSGGCCGLAAVEHLDELGDHLVAAEGGHEVGAVDVGLGLGEELLRLADTLFDAAVAGLYHHQVILSR
jgi:hypothetical protein